MNTINAKQFLLVAIGVLFLSFNFASMADEGQGTATVTSIPLTDISQICTRDPSRIQGYKDQAAQKLKDLREGKDLSMNAFMVRVLSAKGCASLADMGTSDEELTKLASAEKK